ncbi:MAG: hypothetical protein L0Z62_26020 [Gemmataceae bacterium]|nr:hypothetical protein [Gemmataceae bacterium]
MVPPPVVIGLVLCDYVHFESGNPLKISLIGTFDKLAVSGFPATPPFYAYASLTDAVGEATIAVIVERLDTGAVVYTRSTPASFPGKVDTLHVSVPIRRCTFPSAGKYEVILLVDQDPVARRRIRVFQQ